MRGMRDGNDETMSVFILTNVPSRDLLFPVYVFRRYEK